MAPLSFSIHPQSSDQKEAWWEGQTSRSAQTFPTPDRFHKDLDARISRLACLSVPRPGGRPKVEVATITTPEELLEGHALIQIAYSRICNSDRRVLSGTKTSALTEKSTILGHEAIGYVFKSSSGTFAQGDFIVIEPHSVEPNDDMLRLGVPNRSKDMKHLGIHVDGVFADTIMIPEYCVHKVSDYSWHKEAYGDDIYHRQMVCIEPLACVQRGYKLLCKRLSSGINARDIRSVLILGAGPMGVLHGLHLQDSENFSECRIDIYDIDEQRREVVAKNVAFKENVKVIDELVSEGSYDLVVTATSSWDANMGTAPAQVADGGSILLFSGIDLRKGQTRPILDTNVDIESVHRGENAVTTNISVRGIKKWIHFVGTSGYIKDDFETSIEELHRDLRGAKRYQTLATGEIRGLESREIRDLTGKCMHIYFDRPAIISCLAAEDPVSRTQLKIGINHDYDNRLERRQQSVTLYSYSVGQNFITIDGLTREQAEKVQTISKREFSDEFSQSGKICCKVDFSPIRGLSRCTAFWSIGFSHSASGTFFDGGFFGKGEDGFAPWKQRFGLWKEKMREICDRLTPEVMHMVWFRYFSWRSRRWQKIIPDKPDPYHYVVRELEERLLPYFLAHTDIKEKIDEEIEKIDVEGTFEQTPFTLSEFDVRK